MQLLSQSGKEEHGTIDLHLAVKAEEKEVPPDIRVREYTLLLRSMVNLETAKVSLNFISYSVTPQNGKGGNVYYTHFCSTTIIL